MGKYKKIIISVMIISVLLLCEQFANSLYANKVKLKASYVTSPHLVSDSMVVPDKFNTGITNPSIITKVTDSGELNGFTFRLSATEAVNNWLHTTNKQGVDYVIENYDFTNYRIRMYSTEKVTEKTTVTFNNCIFDYVLLSEMRSDNVTYIFNNCTFYGMLAGSNAIVNNCRFITSVGDSTNAFVNMQYNNCFFSIIPVYSTAGKHIDGIQLYGRENIKVEDVHMNNCRIISPIIEPMGTTSHINACIMLKLDYNDADNVTFENMHVTGGGYTIYSQPHKYQMTNITFRNITIGNTYKYGPLYKSKPDGWNGAIHENVELATKLYVGSVWMEGNSLHLSVTNDTNEEKVLKVLLSDGTVKEYTIRKCPNYKEFTEETTYESLPFDQEIIIDNVKPSNVRCYDGDTLIRTHVFFGEPKTLTKISIETSIKRDYVKDMDALDVTGGVIKATYSDSTVEYINITPSMITGFDNSTLGSKKITISYQNKSIQYAINIIPVPRSLETIKISSVPKVVEYIKDVDVIDVTGGVIEATYSDSTTEYIEITPDMVSGFDNKTLGKKEITVTYQDKTTSYTIKIVNEIIDTQNNSLIEGKILFVLAGIMFILLLKFIDSKEKN